MTLHSPLLRRPCFGLQGQLETTLSCFPCTDSSGLCSESLKLPNYVSRTGKMLGRPCLFKLGHPIYQPSIGFARTLSVPVLLPHQQKEQQLCS